MVGAEVAVDVPLLAMELPEDVRESKRAVRRREARGRGDDVAP